MMTAPNASNALFASAPPAAELLNAWERGAGHSVTARVLLLLVATCPDASPQSLMQLSIGQRDGLLLSLREALFGTHLACTIHCPQCQERLELALTVPDMRVAPPGVLQDGEVLSANMGGYALTFRLPTSADVLAIESLRPADAHAAAASLFMRCLLAARHGNEVDSVVVSAMQLPDEIVDAASICMAAADPQADMRLSLTCPGCAHAWLARLDIATFLLVEVDNWARRMMRDVHMLASAYGWRESDILSLSPARRAMYLDLVSNTDGMTG